MDIQKYIASGILEDYALHLLSEEERREVEQNLAKYTALRTELNAIEDALSSFAKAHEQPLSEELSKNILTEIDDLEKKKDQTTNNRYPSRFKTLLVLVSLMLSGVAVVLAIRTSAIKEENLSLKSQLEAYENLQDSLRDSIVILQLRLEAFREKCDQVIILEGTRKSPDAIAFVIFDSLDNKAYLDIIDLPRPPIDKQYQLWAFVENNPNNLGVIDSELPLRTLIEIPIVPGTGGFVITLESQGGNHQPTISEMYAIGIVSQ